MFMVYVVKIFYFKGTGGQCEPDVIPPQKCVDKINNCDKSKCKEGDVLKDCLATCGLCQYGPCKNYELNIKLYYE